MPLFHSQVLSTTKHSDSGRLKYKLRRLLRRREVLEVMLRNNEHELDALCTYLGDLNTHIAVLQETLQEVQ